MVLAGDIHLGTAGVRHAEEVGTYLGVPVILIAGNHEFYGTRANNDHTAMRATLAERAAETAHVRFLDDSGTEIAIGGERWFFLGTTLWTDFALLARGGADHLRQQAMWDARSGLNDYGDIYLGTEILRPEHILEIHHRSRAWLATEVADIRAAHGDAARIVIVTHHAPIDKGCHPSRRADNLAPAYASNMIEEIGLWRPAAWIHGHTHYSHRTLVHQTVVTSACRGHVCLEDGADVFLPAVLELPPIVGGAL